MDVVFRVVPQAYQRDFEALRKDVQSLVRQLATIALP